MSSFEKYRYLPSVSDLYLVKPQLGTYCLSGFFSHGCSFGQKKNSDLGESGKMPDNEVGFEIDFFKKLNENTTLSALSNVIWCSDDENIRY